MNNKELLYKKLNALRLEVHGSIVDDIKSTVDAIFQEQLLQQTPCTTLLPGCQAHYFVQKDQYWLSCAHCGMQKPIGQ